ALHRLRPFEGATEPEEAAGVVGRIGRDVGADLDAAAVRQMGPMAVARREVVHAALEVRAAQKLALLAPRRRADLEGLQVLARVVLDRLPGLRIDAVGLVDLLGVL